jgi:hypothetical protein
MAFDRDTLESILAATGGVCHRCQLPLELTCHAQPGQPGAWEIDVTRPQPKSTVLLPACIPCLPASAATTIRRRERTEARETGPTTPVRIGYAGRMRPTPSGQR